MIKITQTWRPKKFLIAGKRTTYEMIMEQKSDNLDKVAKEFHTTLEEKIDEHAQHIKTLGVILKTLHNHDITDEKIIFRPSMKYEDEDFNHENLLVIALGGDGELLDVARMGNSNAHYMLVKSNGKSVGYLASATADTFDNSLERILNGDYEITNRNRVRGRITYPDGREIVDDGLNEVLVGDVYNMGFFRYDLIHNETKEHQRGDGVVIYSGTGSTAWSKNIIGSIPDEKEKSGYRFIAEDGFAPDADYLKFVVRDFDRSWKPRLTSGTIEQTDKLEIFSHSRADGIVSFDCSKPHYKKPRVYEFNHGAKIELYLSPEPIKVISFK